MNRIGYARVSTTDQDTAVQVEALKAAGCEIIREEKASGTSTQGRKELTSILDFIRKGDTLVVTRIDRLARSIGDLQDIVRALKAKGAHPRRPNSRLIPARRRARRSWTCWGSSQSSRRT